MEAPDKIYIEQKAVMYDMVNTEPCKPDDYEYIRKDVLLDIVKLAYGKVSMNPFDCSEAFEELIGKIESL